MPRVRPKDFVTADRLTRTPKKFRERPSRFRNGRHASVTAVAPRGRRKNLENGHRAAGTPKKFRGRRSVLRVRRKNPGTAVRVTRTPKKFRERLFMRRGPRKNSGVGFRVPPHLKTAKERSKTAGRRRTHPLDGGRRSLTDRPLQRAVRAARVRGRRGFGAGVPVQVVLRDRRNS